MSPPNGNVIIGDVPEDSNQLVLYIIKGRVLKRGRIVTAVVANTSSASADETSYINYIKPLILAQELAIPHVISLIDTTSQWAYKIHPERMVPALRDVDPETGETFHVFEGTACLQYMADRFDTDGEWAGRTAAERGAVFTWVAYQTAGIGYVAEFAGSVYTSIITLLSPRPGLLPSTGFTFYEVIQHARIPSSSLAPLPSTSSNSPRVKKQVHCELTSTS